MVKIRKSIASKILIIIFIILFLSDAVLMSLSYFTVKSTVEDNLFTVVKTSAKSVSDILYNVSLDELKESSEKYDFYYSAFSKLCVDNDIKYIYIYVPNLQKNTIEYIMLVYGANSNDEAKKERYPGKEVNWKLNDAENAAMSKSETDFFDYTNNKYGEVLTCYQPICDSEGNVKALVGVDISIDEVKNKTIRRYTIMLISMLTSLAIVMLLLFIIIKTRLLKPAKDISRKMLNFISDHKDGDYKIEVKGVDEFADMAKSFNQMTYEIDEYIKNIKILTQEKQKQQSEIEIAHDIQLGMLPPCHYKDNSVEIDATMKPARFIGGDFYDYFKTDDTHICTIIADVSGKGISGALFMSKVITVIRQYAELGYSPAEILQKTNNLVAKNNPHMMFITVFIGIYDTTSKAYTFSNAGHNPPYIISKNIEAINFSHGLVLGIFEDKIYEEHSIILNDGDSVFLYTDGVTEAENNQKEFYGNERLEKALDDFSKNNYKSCVDFVLSSITDFVGDAEQSDDVTMLYFSVNNTNAEQKLLGNN